MNFNNIEGHFNFSQVYDEQVSKAVDGSNFLEIGCWLGRSTAYLAEAIKKSKKDIKVHVIDTFMGEGMTEAKNSFRHEFEKNMKDCGVYDIIEIHEGPSEIQIDLLKDDFFDFIYIDGLHTYDNVKSDIIKSSLKLKNNRTLAGHDYQALEVKNAVDELLGFENLSFFQNTWIYNLKK